MIGHSRLVTNGIADNQPVLKDEVVVFHNGIIVNADEIWPTIPLERKLSIDTEIIAALAVHYLEQGLSPEEIPALILERCRGVVACALAFTREREALRFLQQWEYVHRSGMRDSIGFRIGELPSHSKRVR